jgi:DNA-binding HxlR family transcriptional regulator
MASWLDDAEAVIDVISRKWAVQILGALADGPRRHNELLRAVDHGIHPTVLDGTLRHLEHAGLLRREASTGSPPATWYQLTDLARSLLEQIAGLARWSDDNRPMLAALPGWAIE